jgi:hypothetical protein
MKTILILLFSFSSYATQNLQECSEKATTYYSTESISTKIPSQCGELISNIKDSSTSALSSDGSIKISAYKNIIYINNNGVDRFIAGNLSRVHNVISLFFDDTESKIYVLNENPERQREVLSFKPDLTGNVSPIRSLETRELEMATSISVKGNHIYAISSSHDWKKTFNKNADPNGKKPENSSVILREVSGTFDKKSLD